MVPASIPFFYLLFGVVVWCLLPRWLLHVLYAQVKMLQGGSCSNYTSAYRDLQHKLCTILYLQQYFFNKVQLGNKAPVV